MLFDEIWLLKEVQFGIFSLKTVTQPFVTVSFDRKNNNNSDNRFENAMARRIHRSQTMNENTIRNDIKEFINVYANSPTIDVQSDIFEYWKKVSNSIQPLEKAFAKLASYYLTPPPTSVAVERLFSTAGDIVTNERNRLNPQTAEKILFMRENLPLVNFDY